MKRFSVTVTRDVTESATFEVEAENLAEAEELGLEKARNDSDIDWETNAGMNAWADPYYGDPNDDIEEICE